MSPQRIVILLLPVLALSGCLFGSTCSAGDPTVLGKVAATSDGGSSLLVSWTPSSEFPDSYYADLVIDARRAEPVVTDAGVFEVTSLSRSEASVKILGPLATGAYRVPVTFKDGPRMNGCGHVGMNDSYDIWLSFTWDGTRISNPSAETKISLGAL